MPCRSEATPRSGSWSTRRARCSPRRARTRRRGSSERRTTSFALQEHCSRFRSGSRRSRIRAPAPVSDGRSQGVHGDDARSPRGGAAAALDAVRDERDDARRSRCSADPRVLHARRREACAGRVHRRREPAGIDPRDRLRAGAEIDVTFVQIGDASERIWESGVAEAGYTPDPSAAERSRRPLRRSRAGRGGRTGHGGGQVVRSALATGPTTPRRIEGNRQALMPYVALLAILPLGFVLYRRNL